MTFRIGIVGVQHLQTLMENGKVTDTDFQALALKNHRVGFETPVAPSNMLEHIEWAVEWLNAETEEGRDPLLEELTEATKTMGRSPSAAMVPPQPSQS